MQREFTCCGAYGDVHAYQNWKYAPIGWSDNSVPDSCCHSETVGCGKDVLKINDIETIMKKIYVHGCIDVMKVKMITQVRMILIVCAGVGSVLVMLEMLTILLACSLARYVPSHKKTNHRNEQELRRYSLYHGLISFNIHFLFLGTSLPTRCIRKPQYFELYLHFLANQSECDARDHVVCSYI